MRTTSWHEREKRSSYGLGICQGMFIMFAVIGAVLFAFGYTTQTAQAGGFPPSSLSESRFYEAAKLNVVYKNGNVRGLRRYGDKLIRSFEETAEVNLRDTPNSYQPVVLPVKNVVLVHDANVKSPLFKVTFGLDGKPAVLTVFVKEGVKLRDLIGRVS